MPIFVQTDSKVIDVEKITFIDVRSADVKIYFNDGHSLILGNGEADALMQAMSRLDRERALITRRAARAIDGQAPTPSPRAPRSRPTSKRSTG